jgi:hypothetical protein
MPNPQFFMDLALLQQDQAALHLVGMPPEHAAAFAAAARQEQCVISSRQLGRVCTGLMTEGYDTKGFRIKSKSCDFGPMAGFLCLDERFHKKGAAYNARQRADIEHALHGDRWDGTGRWKAGTEQICLTPARLAELQGWNDPENAEAAVAARPVTAQNLDILVGQVARPVALTYLLHREDRQGDSVWALYEAPRETLQAQPVLWRAPFDVVRHQLGLKPIMGLTNPYPPYPRGHYKNCCTGDYDLFGVWPRKKSYEPLGEDRRIAGMVGGTGPDAAQRRDAQIMAWEDKRLGNINDRVHLIAGVINSLLHTGRRGPARDVIHHSDEAGRPFIGGIDDHVIAFIPVPGGRVLTVGVRSPNGQPVLQEWAAFVRICNDLGYQVIANGHWMTQLRAWGVGNVVATGDSHGWQLPHNSPVRST